MLSVTETFITSLNRTNINPYCGYLSETATPQELIILLVFFYLKCGLYDALKGLLFYYEIWTINTLVPMFKYKYTSAKSNSNTNSSFQFKYKYSHFYSNTI